MDVQIPPLPAAFLDRVRRQGTDDQGQPVVRIRSESGGEPCRDVLRRARPGEELILASFTPFSNPGPYREYGPVFVLAEPSSETVDRDAFPEGSEAAGDYFQDRLVLRAYSSEETILDAALVTVDEAPASIDRFFESAEVAFLHARFPTFGCFACRIDRPTAGPVIAKPSAAPDVAS